MRLGRGYDQRFKIEGVQGAVRKNDDARVSRNEPGGGRNEERIEFRARGIRRSERIVGAAEKRFLVGSDQRSDFLLGRQGEQGEASRSDNPEKGMLLGEGVEQQSGAKTRSKFSRIRRLGGISGGGRRLGEALFEGAGAAQISDGEGVGGAAARDEEVDVGVVELDGAGEKRDAELFAMDRILRFANGSDGGAELAFGLGGLVFSGVDLGEARLGLPLQ